MVHVPVGAMSVLGMLLLFSNAAGRRVWQQASLTGIGAIGTRGQCHNLRYFLKPPRPLSIPDHLAAQLGAASGDGA